MLYPMTFCELLAFHERLTLGSCGLMPVPFRVSTARGFAFTSRKESPADTVPVAWGANVTVNPWLAPGGIVTGIGIPPKANSGLLRTAEEMVTAFAPAVRVPV